MIGFSLPMQAATASYSYRDTGDSWPSETSLDYGFAEPTRSFSSPVCDELRITLTYAASTEFNRCFLDNLNIVSGLSFSLDIDGTTFTYSQDVEPVGVQARPKQKQNYRFTPTSGTVVTLTITGIGQKSLGFAQFVMAKLSFTPTLDIQNDSNLARYKSYKEVKTRLGTFQRLDTSNRMYGLNFLKLTNSELFDNLENLFDVKANNGFVLFELDDTSDELSNAFLCYASIQDTTEISTDFNSATANIIEVYGRG